MVVFEKYCDRCGEPTRGLKNVNGRMLCPKCRGMRIEGEDEEATRREKLRKLWAGGK